MTKVVRDHYLAERLPEELRGEIDPKALVRVVVETEEMEKMEGMVKPSDLIGSGRGIYRSPEEALEVIRRLREEWH
jgi:hypothetical protein